MDVIPVRPTGGAGVGFSGMECFVRAQRVRAVRVADRDLSGMMNFGRAVPAWRPRPGVAGDGRAIFERLEPRITMSGDAAAGGIEWVASVHDQPYDRPPQVVPESAITITEQQTLSISGRAVGWTLPYAAVQTVTLLRDGEVISRRVSDYERPRYSDRWLYFSGLRLDGDAVYVARIELARSDGVVSSAELVINVKNAPPYLAASGPDEATVGVETEVVVHQPMRNGRQIHFDAMEDYMAGRTYRVDWDGDGTVDETIRQEPLEYSIAGVNGWQLLNHTYETPGVYTIRITAEDKDGGVSEVVSHTITVLAEVSGGGGDGETVAPPPTDDGGDDVVGATDSGDDGAETDEDADDLLAEETDELASL